MVSEAAEHNHVTRDIEPPGACPACDMYHESQNVGTHAEQIAALRARVTELEKAQGVTNDVLRSLVDTVNQHMDATGHLGNAVIGLMELVEMIRQPEGEL